MITHPKTMIKITLCARDSKTTPYGRGYRLRNTREFEDRFFLYISNIKRLDIVGKEYDDSMKKNSFNYRKIMDTFFEPYD